MHLKCLLSEYNYYEIIIGKVHVLNHALNVYNMHNVSNIDYYYVYCNCNYDIVYYTHYGVGDVWHDACQGEK